MTLFFSIVGVSSKTNLVFVKPHTHDIVFHHNFQHEQPEQPEQPSFL
jgi:hypothetical protein